jgi:hypothetical protein
MGRSYWFECSRCGYRAKVAGRTDRGLHCFVQTILCRDCKELYDAVIRLRIPEPAPAQAAGRDARKEPTRLLLQKLSPDCPPDFAYALSRLLYPGGLRWRWMEFKLRCPVSHFHRIESWTAPANCPRCGMPLEQNPLPYRIWD